MFMNDVIVSPFSRSQLIRNWIIERRLAEDLLLSADTMAELVEEFPILLDEDIVDNDPILKGQRDAIHRACSVETWRRTEELYFKRSGPPALEDNPHYMAFARGAASNAIDFMDKWHLSPRVEGALNYSWEAGVIQSLDAPDPYLKKRKGLDKLEIIYDAHTSFPF